MRNPSSGLESRMRTTFSCGLRSGFIQNYWMVTNYNRHLKEAVKFTSQNVRITVTSKV